MLAPWKKSCDKPRQHIEKQRHHFANKGLMKKAMIFLVVMNRCESWTRRNTELRKMILLNCVVGEAS